MTEIANQNIDIEVVETGGDTAQYFWHNTTDSGAGEGAGAHITEIPKEDFIDDPDAGGKNTLINTDGMAVRDGRKPLAVFSAEQIRLGDFDGGNIVIVPTGFNINNGNTGIQLATFDTKDGIMFKTQQGADALSVAGEGELVTRTIKDVISLNAKILSVRAIISPGTRTSETVIGSAYPTDKTLTVRTSNIYTSSGSYSNHTITYSEDDDTSVQIGSYTYSSNITINAYIVWLTTGELVLRIERINSGSLVVYSDRNLFVDVSYVSYTKDVYIPKISTDGHLYLYGHSTPVGDLMEASTSDYSLTYASGSSSWAYPQGNGTYLSENGLLLPAGRWVIQASLRLQTLTDGAQYGVGVGYGDSRANATIALASRQIVTAGSTSPVILNTTHLADASGSNRYYVGLWHGSKATVTFMDIKAMRVR